MKKLVNDFNLDVFVKGENIDLCIPNEDFARNSSWYSWFNDAKVARFLEQGIFPNTVKSQIDFNNSLDSKNRLALIISDRKMYIGTISLSLINLYKRTADIAMLIGEKSESENANLLALEAMALMTNHAFGNMGLKKITAGQHESLTKWQQKLEILGYRVDGYRYLGFLKGSEEANSVSLTVTYKDYYKILENRKSLWDNTQNMKNRISKLPKNPFVSQLKDLIKNEGDKYYNEIFKL
jgi:RimJ/RimL family protein N-acetyltransferase